MSESKIEAEAYIEYLDMMLRNNESENLGLDMVKIDELWSTNFRKIYIENYILKLAQESDQPCDRN